METIGILAVRFIGIMFILVAVDIKRTEECKLNLSDKELWIACILIGIGIMIVNETM